MPLEPVLAELERILPNYSYRVQRGPAPYALLAQNPRWVLAVVAPAGAAEVRHSIRGWEKDLLSRSAGLRPALVILVQSALTAFDATSLGQLGRRRGPVTLLPMELSALSVGWRALVEAFDPFLAPAEGLASVLSPAAAVARGIAAHPK